MGVVKVISFTSWMTCTGMLAVTSGLVTLAQVTKHSPAFLPVTTPPRTVAIVSSEEYQVRLLLVAVFGSTVQCSAEALRPVATVTSVSLIVISSTLWTTVR